MVPFASAVNRTPSSTAPVSLVANCAGVTGGRGPEAFVRKDLEPGWPRREREP